MQKALALILLAMAPMATPSPTEVVQSGIEQVVQVVQDYDTVASGGGGEAPDSRSAARPGGCSTSRRWRAGRWPATGATGPPGEREEFVSLFRDLLERSYLSRLENYSGERIVYLGETVDGEFATVRSKILTGRTSEVALAYRLHLVGSRWAVYDILDRGRELRGELPQPVQPHHREELLRGSRPEAPPTRNWKAPPSSAPPTAPPRALAGAAPAPAAQSRTSVIGQWSEPWTVGRMPAALTRPRSSSETKK